MFSLAFLNISQELGRGDPFLGGWETWWPYGWV